MSDRSQSAQGAFASFWRVAPGLSLLFLAALLWPLAAFSDLHLQDLPNHLARAFILLHPDDALLNQNYRVDWWIVPDLGWDLWALGLGRLLPLMWLAKLLVAVTFSLGVAGSLAMGRALTGRWTLVPLLAVPFLLNGAYFKAFLSFNLGLALSFWAIAWWVWAPERYRLLRLAVATLFATVLYVVHFFAFGIYGLFVLGFELQRFWQTRRERPLLYRTAALILDGLQAVPALVLLLAAMGRFSSSPIAIVEREPWARFGDVSLLIESGYPWADIAVIIGYLGILIASAARGWFGFSSKATLALTLYFAAFLLLPDDIVITSYLPWRAALPLVFIGIASMTSTWRTPRLLLPALLSVALAIGSAVTIVQSRSWSRSAAEKSNFLSAIASIPDGSKLFFAHSGIPQGDLVRDEDGAYHVASYAVIAKRALVQTMFVSSGQVLRFRDDAIQAAPRNSDLFLADIADNFAAAHADFRSHLAHFQYIVLHGEDRDLEARMFSFAKLELIGRVADYRLYRVLHP